MKAVVGLWIIVVLSAVTLVYSTHEVRGLYSVIAKEEAQRDAMINKWHQLKLEEGYVAGAKIEARAKTELSMKTPEFKDLVVVK